MLASKILPLKCDVVQANLHSILHWYAARTPLPPYMFDVMTVRDSAKYIVKSDRISEKEKNLKGGFYVVVYL